MIPFTENSRKCKLIYGDRMQTSGCLGQVGGEAAGEGRVRGVTKGRRKAGDDGYVHYLSCDDDSMGVCMCQNISNCTL